MALQWTIQKPWDWLSQRSGTSTNGTGVTWRTKRSIKRTHKTTRWTTARVERTTASSKGRCPRTARVINLCSGGTAGIFHQDTPGGTQRHWTTIQRVDYAPTTNWSNGQHWTDRQQWTIRQPWTISRQWTNEQQQTKQLRYGTGN